MTPRQINSRRNHFKKAGIDPFFYDKLRALYLRLVEENEVEDRLRSPNTRLAEAYQNVTRTWQDEVFNYDMEHERLFQKPQEQIDFSRLYNLPDYLYALFGCWNDWTLQSMARYITFLKQHPELPRNCIVIADGMGMASAMYAEAFPEAQVRAHIMGSKMSGVFDAAQVVLRQENVRRCDGIPVPVLFQNVVAFECFEHFYAPQIFRDNLVIGRVLCHSSPWNVPAHGHFKKYCMDGVEVDASEMPKLFGRWLRTLEFVSSAKAYKFRCFNGSPEIYIKQ